MSGDLPSREELEELVRSAAELGSREDQERALEVVREVQWREAMGEDAWVFIRDYCHTEDSHERGSAVYKKFPDLPFLEHLAGLPAKYDLIINPKSRQIMATWIWSAVGLHAAMSSPGQLILVQSKKADDADKVLDRIWTMYEGGAVIGGRRNGGLPGWMRERCPAKRKQYLIEFANKSQIIAIPEGGDQIRSHTASLVLSDESAFQKDFDKALTALYASVEGGGKAVVFSSAKAGPMYDILAEEPIEGSYRVVVPSWNPKQGMVEWDLPSGWHAVQTHYSADPAKDLEWAKRASPRYGPLGMKSKGWQGEMEIDPGAFAGRRVYEIFGRGTHVIPTSEIEPTWPVFVGIDLGYRNPFAAVFLTLSPDGDWVQFDEIYLRLKTIPELARLLKMKLKRKVPEGFFFGHDAPAKTLSEDGASKLEMFEREGILGVVCYSEIEPRIERMTQLLMPAPNGVPQFTVMENCQNTIMEFEEYRYPEETEQQLRTAGEKEKPLKKNDHALDAIGNVVMTISEEYAGRWVPKAKKERKVQSIPQQMMREALRPPSEVGVTNYGMYDDGDW